MSKEPELREEIAAERRELTRAVASLRRELVQTGKRLGTGIGAATGAAVVGKLLFRRLRRR